MGRIRVYFRKDGAAEIRWNKADGIPDRATVERLAVVIREQRKSPIQSSNSEQGSTTETAEAKEQFDNTTSAALRQELLEILQKLPPEDVEEITQRMRDIIQGRA